MKVCEVSTYPPQKCGIGEYARSVVQALEAAGHEVLLVSTSPISAATNRFRMNLASPASVRQAMKWLAVQSPDVVHVQLALSMYNWQVAPLLYLLRQVRMGLRIPVVGTLHCVKQESHLLRGLYPHLLTALFAHVTVHTQEAYDLLCGVLPKGRLHRVPHIASSFQQTEEERPDSLRETWGVGTRRLALSLGYVRPEKGLEYLVEATRILSQDRATRAGIAVVIAGEVRARGGRLRRWTSGERREQAYLERLRKMVRDYGLTDVVQFRGFVPSESIHCAVRACQLIVLPYLRTEASGILNMALAARTPVVASNVGEFAERLQGAGALVPPADAGALAVAMREMLFNDELRAESQRACERASMESEPAAVARQLAEIFALAKRDTVRASVNQEERPCA